MMIHCGSMKWINIAPDSEFKFLLHLRGQLPVRYNAYFGTVIYRPDPNTNKGDYYMYWGTIASPDTVDAMQLEYVATNFKEDALHIAYSGGRMKYDV